MDRDRLRDARQSVIKIGTAVLTTVDGSIDQQVPDSIAAGCAELIDSKRTVTLVSSGAIALGVKQLGLCARPKRMDGLQACAAVGQSRLMALWSEAFARHRRAVAQVLLTHADLADRKRFLNARRCISELHSRGAIPVINENDTVAIEEIAFGDNDSLAAQVANLINADLLVMLSLAAGLLDGDRRISRVDAGDRCAEHLVRSQTSPGGTGGMATKLSAARSASARGITTVIAGGKEPHVLRRIFAGEDVGTLFAPAPEGLRSRAHWIAHTLRPKGTIVVDKGAAAALLDGKRSLLPSGVISIRGSFGQGDAVDLADADLRVFARGLSTYSSSELESIRGKRSSEILATLHFHLGDEVVHRDDLVLLDRNR